MTNITPSLTRGPIGRSIWTMTLGMLVGQAAMTAFNITDTWFVSRLGTLPLAAMAFTFPVVLIVNGVMFGLGIGASSIISRVIGQGDRDQVRRLTTHALWLTVVLGLLMAVLGLATYRHVFELMGAEGETLDLTLSYMRIWFLGFPVGGIPMVMNNAIRATGDAKTPGVIMAVVAGVNAVLDPIFIFGLGPVPALGLEGAAIATVIGRVISTAWALHIIHRRLHMIDWHLRPPHLLWDSWRRFLTMGLPATGTMIVLPLSGALLTRLIAHHGGDPAVAAWGAGGRVDGLTFMLVMAMGSVLLPFVGQNEGAGRQDRSTKGVAWALKVGMTYCTVAGGLIYLFAPNLTHLFTDDPAAATTLVHYLRIISLCYPAVALAVMSYNGLMGLDRPVAAFVLTLLRNLGLYVPLAWLGGRLMGVPGVLWGVFIGAYVSGVMAWLLYRHYQKVAALPAD